MAETAATTPPSEIAPPAAGAPAAPAPAYLDSTEAGASDPEAPQYIFEGPGEILALKGDYAQLRWRRPVPDVWLRLDQLEAC